MLSVKLFAFYLDVLLNISYLLLLAYIYMYLTDYWCIHFFSSMVILAYLLVIFVYVFFVSIIISFDI